jgi:hypothetical protein
MMPDPPADPPPNPTQLASTRSRTGAARLDHDHVSRSRPERSDRRPTSTAPALWGFGRGGGFSFGLAEQDQAVGLASLLIGPEAVVPSITAPIGLPSLEPPGCHIARSATAEPFVSLRDRQQPLRGRQGIQRRQALTPLGAVEPRRGMTSRRVECTIRKSGDRASNAAPREIVMAVKTCQDFYGLTTKVSSAFL